MTNTHKTQPEQEPVANGYVFVAISILEKLGINKAVIDVIATTSPQRKPLTDEQREEIAKGWRGRNWTLGDIIDAVEAAHGIKGDA